MGDDVYLAGLVEKAPQPVSCSFASSGESEKDEWEKIQQLAADGKDEDALQAIVSLADSGPVAEQMIPVVTVVLEGVKNDLKMPPARLPPWNEMSRYATLRSSP